MAVEIEAKMKVSDLGVVREKLKKLGATPSVVNVETNLFFDTRDRSLLTADKGLRLRVNKSATTGEEAFIITFKGPRHQSALKSREEVELTVDSRQNAETLLAALGYIRVLAFEKKRESWDLGGCEVELDELPHLGFYVEIEGRSDEAIRKVQRDLALADLPIIKTSYVAIMLSYLQERGDSDRVVEFPK